ncbi:hypothetical protein GTZ85_47890 [Streptomyces sp. SID5474]|nr:hypothetical protein [Streptomyces sp. SID5474]
MLFALVVYCYSKGVRSSRRIESSCLDDVGCRIITANRTIDHSTIARFIRRHGQALKSLFVQVLAACGRHGLVDPSAVAIDGSPMTANASRDSNRSTEALERIVNDCEIAVTEELDAESNSGRPPGRPPEGSLSCAIGGVEPIRPGRACSSGRGPRPARSRSRSTPPSASSPARKGALPPRLPLIRHAWTIMPRDDRRRGLWATIDAHNSAPHPCRCGRDFTRAVQPTHEKPQDLTPPAVGQVPTQQLPQLPWFPLEHALRCQEFQDQPVEELALVRRRSDHHADPRTQAVDHRDGRRVRFGRRIADGVAQGVTEHTAKFLVAQGDDGPRVHVLRRHPAHRPDVRGGRKRVRGPGQLDLASAMFTDHAIDRRVQNRVQVLGEFGPLVPSPQQESQEQRHVGQRRQVRGRTDLTRPPRTLHLHLRLVEKRREPLGDELELLRLAQRSQGRAAPARSVQRQLDRAEGPRGRDDIRALGAREHVQPMKAHPRQSRRGPLVQPVHRQD